MRSFAFRCNRNTEDMFISTVVFIFCFAPHPSYQGALKKILGGSEWAKERKGQRDRDRSRFCFVYTPKQQSTYTNKQPNAPVACSATAYMCSEWT